MPQLTCPVCSEVIVDTVDDFEEALVPIIMHHAIQEEREKIARAVMELHKSNYGLCKECTNSVVHVPYPCRTIQAIEKGLL